MIKDPYKRIATLYDRAVEPFNKGIRNFAFKLTSIKQGANVLEVGCGTGANLELYLKSDCNIHGIDLSPSMLKIANSKFNGKAKFLNADASNMKEYNNNSFDLVIAMLTLHEMPQSIRLKVLQEMKRVLKNDGQIMLIDYHSGKLKFPMGWIFKAIIIFFEIVAGREHFNNYRNFIKNGALPPLIERLNLVLVKRKIISKGTFAIFQLKTGDNQDTLKI